MSTLLARKSILVIGGGSGIGRATALAAAREGAQVMVGDRDAEAAARVAAEVPGMASVEVDVADAAAVAYAVSLTVERNGRLDGLVNCAARPEPFRSLLDATEEDFASIMDVNVRGTWLVMRAAAAQMRIQSEGGGSIVNVASVAGLKGSALMAIYSASKHAVVGLTRSAALEFAKTGPRINAVCPGVIETPMMRGVTADPRARASFERSQPNGRFGDPREVAEACVWLLSDHASLVTGSVMAVDGGLST